ncbi:hypothetical protein SRHO_G00122260 [Serrasalmus rhombeus]
MRRPRPRGRSGDALLQWLTELAHARQVSNLVELQKSKQPWCEQERPEKRIQTLPMPSFPFLTPPFTLPSIHVFLSISPRRMEAGRGGGEAPAFDAFDGGPAGQSPLCCSSMWKMVAIEEGGQLVGSANHAGNTHLIDIEHLLSVDESEAQLELPHSQDDERRGALAAQSRGRLRLGWPAEDEHRRKHDGWRSRFVSGLGISQARFDAAWANSQMAKGGKRA